MESGQQILKRDLMYCLKKWMIYRIPAFLFWYKIIGKPGNFLSVNSQISENIVLSIPFWVVCIIIIIKEKSIYSGLLYIGYLIAFPFIILFFIVNCIIKLIKAPVLVIKALMSKLAFIMTIGIAIIVLILLLNSSLLFYKTIFSAILLVLLLIFILQMLKWSVDPFSISCYYTNIFFSIFRKGLHFIFLPKKIDKSLDLQKIDEKTKKLKDLLRNINEGTKNYNDVLDQEYSLIKLLPLIVVGIIAILSVISVVFALNIFYVDKITSYNFNGLNEASSFFDYFYFVISSIIGSVPGNIEPTTRLGKLYVLSLVIIGLLIFTLLISILLNSILSRNSPSFEEMKKFPSKFSYEINFLLGEWEKKKEEINKT